MTTLFEELVRQATWADGIDSLESIPGLLKRLQYGIGLFLSIKKTRNIKTILKYHH